MYQAIPQRCPRCDRYCDGCTTTVDGDPLAAARGIIYAAVLGFVTWGIFVGCLAIIFFNIHA